MAQEQNPQVAELRREIQTLEGRDFQIWSIGLLMILVIAAGFIALILPNIMWNLGVLRVEGRYLPQLFFGFIALILLFNIYAFEQRHVLRNAREELVRQLIRAEAAERLSLVDPLTEIFNRRYLDQIVAKETSRADRLGTSLTFMMVDVDGFKSANTRFGHLVGDRILKEVAAVLKKTLRASDTIIRYGGDEFLVVLSETNEPQGQRALERLLAEVNHWNRTSVIPHYTLRLSYGLAAYTKGASATEVIRLADERMYQQKLRHSAAA